MLHVNQTHIYTSVCVCVGIKAASVFLFACFAVAAVLLCLLLLLLFITTMSIKSLNGREKSEYDACLSLSKHVIIFQWSWFPITFMLSMKRRIHSLHYKPIGPIDGNTLLPTIFILWIAENHNEFVRCSPYIHCI